jgi:PIN domain nuclease of toxin-antitoxin system
VGLCELPLRYANGERLRQLPSHHADPFDRMLIAQAQAEGLTVITHDRKFEPYPVQVLWT